MQTEGVVTRVDGSIAQVELLASCNSCSSSGCGMLSQKKHRAFHVLNSANVRIGDRVVIEIPEGALLRSILLCYVSPLVFTLIGAILGETYAGEVASVTGALLGLFTGWIIVRWSEGTVTAPRVRLKRVSVTFVGDS